MKGKLNIKAVVIGTAVDLITSLVFGLATGIIVGILYARSGNDLASFEQYLASSLQVQLVSLTGGLFCIALGGFIASRIAKDAPIFNAVAVGVLGIIIGLFFIGKNQFWFNVASFLLIVPAAYLGGILGSRTSKSNQAV